MSGDHFAPPDEQPSEVVPAAIVVGTWLMAGGCVGTAAGAWLVTFGQLDTVAPAGLGGGAVAAIVGALAFRGERRQARQAPALVDGQGHFVRPLSTWLLAVPLVIGALGLFGLVVVASLQADSLTPGFAALGIGVGLLALIRPLWSNRVLTVAVQASENGEAVDALRRLRAIDRSFWVTGAARRVARLNLGLLYLREGRLDDAARYYQRAGAGAGNAWASTGLALVRAIQGRFAEVEALLQAASAAPDGKAAQTEIDGVRLLLVLRRDGPSEARELGQRLVGHTSGGLFLSVLAAAREACGDAAGARELTDEPTVAGFLASGLGDVIPELQALRRSS